MKEIKINEINGQKISDAINLAQGHLCKVNMLSVDTIINVAETAEQKMDSLDIPIKHRSGAEYYYRPGGPAAKSYKFGQGATDVRIIRKNSGWYIKNISRTNVYWNNFENNDLFLTEEQHEIAVTKFCKHSNIKKLPKPVEEPTYAELIS